jgi:hypothetical protein
MVPSYTFSFRVYPKGISVPYHFVPLHFVPVHFVLHYFRSVTLYRTKWVWDETNGTKCNGTKWVATIIVNSRVQLSELIRSNRSDRIMWSVQADLSLIWSELLIWNCTSPILTFCSCLLLVSLIHRTCVFIPSLHNSCFK